MPAYFSRSGSEMSVASGGQDDHEDLEYYSRSPSPQDRAQRRQREEEEDAEADALAYTKRYCVDATPAEQSPPPSFAEMARRATPPRHEKEARDKAAATTAAAPPSANPRYPPLVVERMPDWTTHFRVLREQLGYPPHARPFQNGVRFTPKSAEEYRVVQRYLTTLEWDTGLSWFAYSLPAERSLKVAIRGLPADTDPQEILNELLELGYQPEYVRHIKARQGRPGCVFHAVLARTPNFRSIYDTAVLLNMRGVRIEAWRGKRGPAQCHRCQQFRHSSHNCHRPPACVRCGEGHLASDCPRPREEPPTCANCGGEHPACSIRCPVFQREAQNRRAGTVALSLPTRSQQQVPQCADEEVNAADSLMAAANAPPARGTTAKRRRRRRRKNRGGKKGKQPQEAAAYTEPTTTALAPEAPLAPARTAAAKEARRPRSPMPRREQDADAGNTTSHAIQVLLGAIKSLREGADPKTAVLDGLTAVLNIYNG